jgi:hypothetical protein
LLFINTTRIEAGALKVTDTDRLLVAASAIISVWGFPNWHCFNVVAVFLLPGTFNNSFECGMEYSHSAGMVGTGPMTSKMALSRPHLYLGFKNSRDKSNVGIMSLCICATLPMAVAMACQSVYISLNAQPRSLTLLSIKVAKLMVAKVILAATALLTGRRFLRLRRSIFLSAPPC